MDQRRKDSAYSSFVPAEVQQGSRPADRRVSRGALRLHVSAVLASIEAGRPGLITDDYLNAVSGETSIAALELWTAGLWTRVATGYEVPDAETMRMASEVHRQLEELSDRCRATGGHVPDADHPGLCRMCAVRLDG